MRAAISVVMAIVFAVLAAIALVSAARAALETGFRPGNFPPDVIAVTGIVLAGMAVAWFLQSRGQHRVGGWMMAFGGLIGLLLGAYGIWGTSVLIGNCSSVQMTAMIASSIPSGYCGSDAHKGSLLIGYYMTAVGIASVVSLGASAWIRRNELDPALD